MDALGEAMDMAKAELRAYLAKTGGRRPMGLTMGLEGEEWVCAMDSPGAQVVRLRRITGYVSPTANWQQSKLSELKARVAHVPGLL